MAINFPDSPTNGQTISWNGTTNVWENVTIDRDSLGLGTGNDVVFNSVETTNGLIVGAGSGSYGEWIDAVKNNLTSAVLIEPDVVSFNQLYKNYSTYKNLTFLNVGADIRNGMSTFWISPDVNLSSIIKQNSLKYGFKRLFN